MTIGIAYNNMPTYRYVCEKCGRTFDILKLMSKCEEEENCNNCNIPAKRQIGKGAGIIFKGDGFYQTDYKNKGL